MICPPGARRGPPQALAGVSKGIFAVPASLASLELAKKRDPDNSYLETSVWASGATWFQGLLMYTTDLDAFGNLTHHSSDFYDVPESDDGYYYSSYRNSRESGAHATRSLRRGDDLFTFSDNHVVKTSLDGTALAGVADLAEGVLFPDDDGGGGGYYYWW